MKPAALRRASRTLRRERRHCHNFALLCSFNIVCARATNAFAIRTAVMAAPPAWRYASRSPWAPQLECSTATQDGWRHALRNSRPS
eukprot:6191536-Pleurochrysis_carterae.AAC.2